MGAGQIGGIATLLDIDFDNPAHFLGVPADTTEGQFIVAYLSHAMMFCVGALIEAHVVLTPASCVFGERFKFDVFGGTHKFVEHSGVTRQVHHLCLHKGYNHSNRWHSCSNDNLALLVLSHQFSFHERLHGADFIINRVRYGGSGNVEKRIEDPSCKFFGWGSRRNGYLVPLLIQLRRMDVTILSSEKCLDMWNYKEKYLCIRQPQCKDDMGSLIVCQGYAQGMMTSRLVDRPCGVGFLDLSQYSKFLTCGVDDSRDVIDHDDFMTVEIAKSTAHHLATPSPSTSASPKPELVPKLLHKEKVEDQEQKPEVSEKEKDVKE